MNIIEASRNNNLTRVRELIQENPDCVYEKDNCDWTALMRASGRGHLEVIKELLNAGANVYEKDNYGRTALIWASWCGNLEVVKELLKVDPKIVYDKTNDYGQTALIWASWNGHLDVVKELLKIDPKIVYDKDNDGWTALILASRSGRTEVVKLLEKVEWNLNMELLIEFFPPGLIEGELMISI